MIFVLLLLVHNIMLLIPIWNIVFILCSCHDFTIKRLLLVLNGILYANQFYLMLYLMACVDFRCCREPSWQHIYVVIEILDYGWSVESSHVLACAMVLYFHCCCIEHIICICLISLWWACIEESTCVHFYKSCVIIVSSFGALVIKWHIVSNMYCRGISSSTLYGLLDVKVLLCMSLTYPFSHFCIGPLGGMM